MTITSRTTFPDEWLDQWAAVYQEPRTRWHLKKQGVTFERFICAPEMYLERIPEPLRITVHPPGLLPAQRDAQRKADLAAALAELTDKATEQLLREGATVSNGRVAEKLRHHRAWPRGSSRFDKVA